MTPEQRKIVEVLRDRERTIAEDRPAFYGTIAAKAKANADALTALLASADDARRLRELLIDVTAHLVAATSLLERGGKKAAASDKMFAQMLKDYAASAERARAAMSADAQP